MDKLGPLLPILLLVAAFWLLIVKPARARQSQTNAVMSQLEVGKRVMTTSGLFGTVTDLEDGEVELEIAPAVRVRYVRAAIAKVIEPVAPTGTSASDDASVLQNDTPEA